MCCKGVVCVCVCVFVCKCVYRGRVCNCGGVWRVMVVECVCVCA